MNRLRDYIKKLFKFKRDISFKRIPMKIAGLYIEGDQVDISIINSRFTSLNKIYEEKIFLNGEDRESTLAELLSQWKNDYGIKGVVVGLDLNHFAYNFVELPVESEVDVRNALNYEMDKYLPLLPEEYYHDFHPLEINEPLIKYLVFSIRKKRIEWILRCLDNAGLRLLGVRCACIEAVNEIASWEKTANIVVLCRDKKRHVGFDLKGSRLSMFVVRNGEDMTSRHEHLVKDGRDVYLWEPYSDDAIHEVNLNYMRIPAHDLIAMSHCRKKIVEMNFSPERHEFSRQDKFSFAIAAMALVSVVILFLSLAISYQKDSSALRKTRVRLEEIKASAWDVVKIKKEIEYLMKKRNYLLTFQKERNKDIEVLRRLSEILPEEVWLSRISPGVKNEKVEIEGRGKRSAEIIGLLEKSTYFKNVKYSSPVRIKDGEERFSISMEMEDEA